MTEKLLGIQIDREGAWAASVDARTGKASPVAYVDWSGRDGHDPVTAFKAHPDLLVASGQTVAALPEEAVHSRYLEVPALHGEALDNAVKSTVLRYLPYDSATTDLFRVECHPLSRQRHRRAFLVFLVDREQRRRLSDTLQMLGRTLDHLEPASLALARWLVWEERELARGTHLFVSLQRREVVAGLLGGKVVYGSFRFRPPLVGLPEWQSPEIPSLAGLEPFVDYLAARLETSAAFFRFRLAGRELPVDSAVVTGRRARDPVLTEALGRRLGLALRVVEPRRLKLSDPTDGAADYLVAAGLSLRNAEV